jgi:hypothetical protein
VPAAYPVQAVLATALIPVTGALALLAGGPVAAVGAAAAVAFYPPLAAAPRDLLSEPLGALGVAAAPCCSSKGAGALAMVAGGRAARCSGSPSSPAPTSCSSRSSRPGSCSPSAPREARAPARGDGRRGGPRNLRCLRAAVDGLRVGVAGRPVPVSSGGASNLFVGTYLPGDGTMHGLKRDLAEVVGRRDPRLRDVPPARLPQERVLDAWWIAAPGSTRSPRCGPRRWPTCAATRSAIRSPSPGWRRARSAGCGWDYSVGSFRARRPWITAVHLALLARPRPGLAAGLARRRAEPLLLLTAAAVVMVTAVNAVLVSEARHALTVLPLLFAAGAAGWATVVAPGARPGVRRVLAGTLPLAVLPRGRRPGVAMGGVARPRPVPDARRRGGRRRPPAPPGGATRRATLAERPVGRPRGRGGAPALLLAARMARMDVSVAAIGT